MCQMTWTQSKQQIYHHNQRPFWSTLLAIMMLLVICTTAIVRDAWAQFSLAQFTDRKQQFSSTWTGHFGKVACFIHFAMWQRLKVLQPPFCCIIHELPTHNGRLSPATNKPKMVWTALERWRARVFYFQKRNQPIPHKLTLKIRPFLLHCFGGWSRKVHFRPGPRRCMCMRLNVTRQTTFRSKYMQRIPLFEGVQTKCFRCGHVNVSAFVGLALWHSIGKAGALVLSICDQSWSEVSRG